MKLIKILRQLYLHLNLYIVNKCLSVDSLAHVVETFAKMFFC
jgi:hypothetical protein